MVARFSILIIFVLTAVIGCADDDNPISAARMLPQMVGDWTATQVEFTSKLDAAKIDLITLGGSLELSINALGRFRFTITEPDGSVQTEEGIIIVEGSQLRAIEDNNNDEEVFTYSISGNAFALRNENEEFDLNGDGVEEAAVLDVLLQRDE